MTHHPHATPGEHGLLVDFGGVLTSSVARSFRAFERQHELPKGTIFQIVEEAYRAADGTSPIVAFETGDSTAEEFALEMASHLADRGHDVPHDGLARRLFDQTTRVPEMWELVGRARRAGVRTALLSNSWGLSGYPVDDLQAIFDTLVISGEVGVRKPDPRIFTLAAERLDLPPTACVFVDDLERNVEAAREVGMRGVHHVDVTTTAQALSALLAVDLTGVA